MATLFEQAMAQAEESAARVVRIPKPSYLGQVFICHLPNDGTDIDRLRSAAKRIGKGHAEEFHFARAMLAEYVDAIEWHGQVMTVKDVDPTSDDESPVTFKDTAFREATKAATGADAVFRFLKNDGDITSVANKLVEESGYGTEDFAAYDPTEG